MGGNYQYCFWSFNANLFLVSLILHEQMTQCMFCTFIFIEVCSLSYLKDYPMYIIFRYETSQKFTRHKNFRIQGVCNFIDDTDAV